MEYNLLAEYGTICLISVILISFIRDYESQTDGYKFLKFMYGCSLISSFFTVSAIQMPPPGNSVILMGFSYTIQTLYYIFIPLITVCYVYYVQILTAIEADKIATRKRIAVACIPYSIYVLIILSTVPNGYLFRIDSVLGYVRGPLYQLPFYIAAINIILILVIVFRHQRVINHDTVVAVILNMLIALALLFAQAMFSSIIITGLCNTLSILAVHLYSQKSSKSIDQLTKIKNNLSLRLILENFIKKNEDFSLYVFSLRGFKTINERNGLEFGDKVLCIVSKIFLNYLSYETVYRYGGDEFGVILKKNNKNEFIVRNILKHFESPLNVDGDEVLIDLVCARVDNKLFGASVKELISSVDYSISILKQTHGEPKYLYDTMVVKNIIAKTNMVEQIKEAIDNDMFEVFYQPMYSTVENCFSQAEALVRMRDPAGNLLSPAVFIDVAETTGLVVPMTYLILDRVCFDFRNLINTYGDDLLLDAVSVNFSYHQFLCTDMEDRVMEILNKHDIKPRQIKIEITERTLISDATITKEAMDRMRDLGFVFELDDFGVDYSNMSTLLNLPLHIVKLDRSVLLSAMETSNNMKFFQYLIKGINATQRITIVEGVEDSSQLDFVFSCGCEYIQGYIFSKPLPIFEFDKFMQPISQHDKLSEFNLI